MFFLIVFGIVIFEESALESITIKLKIRQGGSKLVRGAKEEFIFNNDAII